MTNGFPSSVAGQRPTIKAIDTIYRSHRFRSRLEARYAVFLDWLHADWVYEQEGYVVDGKPYLPDFWLPDRQVHIEIKGTDPTPEEKDKARGLQMETNRAVALFHGLPGSNEGTVYCWNSLGTPEEVAMRVYGLEFFGLCFYCKLWDDGHCRFYSDPLQDEWNSIQVTDRVRPDQCFHDAVSAAKMARFEYGENPAPRWLK